MAQINKKNGTPYMHKDECSHHRILTTLLFVFLLLMMKTVSAAPLLYDVRYNPLLKGETELQLVFDEELQQQPDVQVFNNPARIELLFNAVELDEGLANIVINQAGISNISSMMTSAGLKVTINLERLKIYEAEVNNNLFSIRISDNPLAKQIVTTSEDAPARASNYINGIQAIDFRRGEKGEAKYLFICKIHRPLSRFMKVAGKSLQSFTIPIF